MQAEMWKRASTLDAQGIAACIPHAGCMSLLQGVRDADPQQLCAIAVSHRQAKHPLALNGRLGAATGIEYAAQAMALHGALMQQAVSSAASVGSDALPKSTAGYLVSVRNLELQVQRLDDIAEDLLVQVRQSGDNGAFTVYDFMLHADERSPRFLLGGKAYVVLQGMTEGNTA